MNWWKNLLIGFLLVTLCIQMGSADQNGIAGNEVVKIGAIYNLKGSQSTLDVPSSLGAFTAERIINQNGGINGVLVDVILRDGASDPATIEKDAEDLILNESVPVIIGMSDTDMVLPAARVAADYHVPFITSGASSPRLPEEVPDYLYLACFGDNAQAALSAEFAYRNLSCRSATVVYDAGMQYTQLLARYFMQRFSESGGDIVAEIPITSKDDLTSVLTNFTLTDQPDLYYIAVGPEDAPLAVRTIHNGKVTVPIFGGDSYDTENLLDAVMDADGDVYYTTHAWFGGNNLSPQVQAFMKEYRVDYWSDPTPFAGLGYDTVMIAAKAAGHGLPGQEIREGIDQIKEYEGVTGTISYENGSAVPKKSVCLMLARGDNLTQVETRVPEKIPVP